MNFQKKLFMAIFAGIVFFIPFFSYAYQELYSQKNDYSQLTGTSFTSSTQGLASSTPINGTLLQISVRGQILTNSATYRLNIVDDIIGNHYSDSQLLNPTNSGLFTFSFPNSIELSELVNPRLTFDRISGTGVLNRFGSLGNEYNNGDCYVGCGNVRDLWFIMYGEATSTNTYIIKINTPLNNSATSTTVYYDFQYFIANDIFNKVGIEVEEFGGPDSFILEQGAGIGLRNFRYNVPGHNATSTYIWRPYIIGDATTTKIYGNWQTFRTNLNFGYDTELYASGVIATSTEAGIDRCGDVGSLLEIRRNITWALCTTGIFLFYPSSSATLAFTTLDDTLLSKKPFNYIAEGQALINTLRNASSSGTIITASTTFAVTGSKSWPMSISVDLQDIADLPFVGTARQWASYAMYVAWGLGVMWFAISLF